MRGQFLPAARRATTGSASRSGTTAGRRIAPNSNCAGTGSPYGTAPRASATHTTRKASHERPRAEAVARAFADHQRGQARPREGYSSREGHRAAQIAAGSIRPPRFDSRGLYHALRGYTSPHIPATQRASNEQMPIIASDTATRLPAYTTAAMTFCARFTSGPRSWP